METKQLMAPETGMMALSMGMPNGLATENTKPESPLRAQRLIWKSPMLSLRRAVCCSGSSPIGNGKDGDDYRVFDASFGPIYFFISKGANHADINPEDFGFYFEAADDADWQDVEFDPAGIITKDKWFHVAATWDFDGGNPFLYIDGKEAATSGKKITGGFPKLHEKPRFGWETIPYIPFKNGAEGVIDEISFWQRALEEAEIQEMMDVSLDVEAAGKLAVTWGELKTRQ